MKQLRSIIVVAIFVGISGCGEPTIDASNNESMKETAEKVRQSLPEGKRKEFNEAMQVLAFSEIDMKDLFSEGVAETGALESKMKDALHGKTADEVIAEAEQIRAQRKERERKQALKEIDELMQKQAAAERARETLKKFEVVRSRYYQRERQFAGKQPIIELTVKNGTDSAISRAYFEGTLASPDRSVPWVQDTFNYSIAGGLEPGEEATWTLAPNQFSDWGTVDVPSDAILTVTVEQLDGPGGESLYSTRDFTSRDKKRLAELTKQYSAGDGI